MAPYTVVLVPSCQALWPGEWEGQMVEKVRGSGRGTGYVLGRS